MIIVNLTLGLGNNLFQYSLGRRLALERDTELLFDLSSQNRSRRDYLFSYMSRFNVVLNIATKKQTAKIKLLNRFNFLNPQYKNSVFYQDGRAFVPSVLNAPKNAYLHGYWQSEKYFKPIRNLICQDFTFKGYEGFEYEEMLDKIKNSNSVSVHIRRDDYLWAKNIAVFTVTSPDYYRKAEAYISERVSSPRLFIFSDDIEWVKQNMNFVLPVTFVTDSKLKDYHEIMLMRACKHNIIANSTFSWWGAWLNDNPDKIVISPEHWFTKQTEEDDDLIPPTWIKI